MAARCIDRKLGVLLPLALLASGCGVDLQPCFGLSVSERIQVDVVSVYSAEAGYDFSLNADVNPTPCPDAFQIETRSVLDTQVVEQEENPTRSCIANTVDVTGGIQLPLRQRAPWLRFGSETEEEILHATHALTVDGCRGRWGISVETRSGSYGEHGDAFLPAPASGYPPIVMYVGFDPDEPDSPVCRQLLAGLQGCIDYYVVELHRP
jgi:hypothetical protein